MCLSQLDPRDLDHSFEGREHFKKIFAETEANKFVCSLGDLGESKDCTGSGSLFAGTTECFQLAREFLDGFGEKFDVVGGNHDLEGIDEFFTDEANLEAYLNVLGKKTPQFCHEVAEKTLVVGLGSTAFRSAKYTSHEVVVDDEQIAWFEETIKSHPASEGWKIFVFSHAPIIGSGLRVLQECHVVNGCCWLNHNDGPVSRKFIEIVRDNTCIKGWFSGHFHLSHDYEDSTAYPEGNNRGACVFAQTAVMRGGASRDGRQQSRLIRGDEKGFEICTIDHKRGGIVRLDATISYTDENHEVGVYAHGHDEVDEMGGDFLRVYSPTEGDECFVDYDNDGYLDATESTCVDGQTIAWWKLSCGRVLGVYDGRLIEYDPSTLAPLGLVVGQDELAGRRIVVVPSGEESCQVEGADGGREVADCETEAEEQAVCLIDDATGSVTVVQPNEDGSYWRKIVRNKIVRMKEKRRVEAAARLVDEIFPTHETDQPTVFSSWGPYTQISGTASKTRVEGVTSARAPSTTKLGEVKSR